MSDGEVEDISLPSPGSVPVPLTRVDPSLPAYVDYFEENMLASASERAAVAESETKS